MGVGGGVIKLLVLLRMSFSILFPTNEYATSNKSPEEIQKLTLPADYSIEQTLIYIMNKGVPVQLPFLFANFHKAFSNVLAFVCSKAQQQGQNQTLIAQSFLEVVQGRGQQQATGKELQLIFDTCLQCLNNLQSPSNALLAQVVDAVLLRHPNAKELLRRMEEKAIELGKATQPLLSRIAACRLVSLVGPYCNRALRGQLVQVVKRVAGESEVQAQKVWLGEIFPRLLQHLQLQFIELHFQERIYETVWGENQEASRLALQAILSNATRFSNQEQASRIVKLFIDSLTAKNERTALVAVDMMGEVYQKLQGVILQSQANCVRFWKSLIELAQTRSEKLMNRLLYNLYGILSLAAPHHRVDALCDLYIALFYSPITDKLLLAAYFHRMAMLFPNKAGEMREVLIWMLNEILTGEDLADDAFRIIGIIISNLHESASNFLKEPEEREEGDGNRYFEERLSEALLRYLNLLMGKKVSSWITDYFKMVSNCAEYFAPAFLEQFLLPKLYSCLRGKAPGCQLLTETVVRLATRDSSQVLINAYVSKVSNELSKSTRSYERETALLFYYYFSFHLSIEVFREYKLGEKYLGLNNDRVFKVRAAFLTHLPRIYYFLGKEERLEYGIIVARINKDPDPELLKIAEDTNFSESEAQWKAIQARSGMLRDREKERALAGNLRRQQAYLGRSNKELRKEDILKKRIDSTKAENKAVLKEIPKKKLTPILLKANSNYHLHKRN